MALTGCSTPWPNEVAWVATPGGVDRAIAKLPPPSTAPVPTRLTVYTAVPSSGAAAQAAVQNPADGTSYRIRYVYRSQDLIAAFAARVAQRHFASQPRCALLQVGIDLAAVQPEFAGQQDAGLSGGSYGDARVAVKLDAHVGHDLVLADTYEAQAGGFTLPDDQFAGPGLQAYMSSVLDQAFAEALDRGFAALADRIRAQGIDCSNGSADPSKG